MNKFFQRIKTKGEAPQITSFGNLMTFYSLLFFLLAIPFVLIIALVWLTGVLGFSAWIIAGFVVLMALVCWRIYRQWGKIKARMAAHGEDVKDIVRDATRTGKDVEVTLMNGLLTFRYGGHRYVVPPALAQSGAIPLALEAPGGMGGEEMDPGMTDLKVVEPAVHDPSVLRQELEGFIRLRDSGVISAEEFDAIKSRLMENFADKPLPDQTGKVYG